MALIVLHVPDTMTKGSDARMRLVSSPILLCCLDRGPMEQSAMSRHVACLARGIFVVRVAVALS